MRYDDRLYKVWYKEYDENGNEIGEGVSTKEYKTYGHANNYAYKHYGDHKRFKYVVAFRNPFKEYTTTEPCGICGCDVVMKEHHYGQKFRNNHITISKIATSAKKVEGGNRRVYRSFTCCDDCFNKLMEFIGEDKEKNND
jgi:hypothetical protein